MDSELALRRSALVSGVRGFLLPFPEDGRLQRLGQLYTGLVVFGISTSLLVLGRHGLVPWDVLHQGLSRHTGLAIGTWSILISVAVLVFWVPLHERPGVGTISNAVVVGATMDVVLGLAPEVHDSVARWSCSLGGVLLNGVATGMYIGAGLGPGPRDGLMTGLARTTGRSLRLVRSGIEAAVLAIGWALGGSVGVGTVVYLVAIGPLAHFFVPFFSRRSTADLRTKELSRTGLVRRSPSRTANLPREPTRASDD